MTKLTAKLKGLIPLQHLRKTALEAHVFDNLHNSSLISLCQLCDNDCWIFLNKHKLHVFKDLHHILMGTRNQQDGLWDIHLTPLKPTPSTHQHANVIIRKSSTKKDLIQFYHGACFSPVKSTLLRAIKNGNFLTWPGFTYAATNKFLTTTIPTILGHLQQERKNLHSTKPNDDQDFPPSGHPQHKNT